MLLYNNCNNQGFKTEPEICFYKYYIGNWVTSVIIIIRIIANRNFRTGISTQQSSFNIYFTSYSNSSNLKDFNIHVTNNMIIPLKYSI